MRTHLKSIAGFLIVFIIFQSCVSAKNMTVYEAVHQIYHVRIKTVEGEKHIYKKLIRRDSILYRVKRVPGVGLIEQDLSHLNIIEVKYASPAATAVLVVVSVVGVLFIIVAVSECASGRFCII